MEKGTVIKSTGSWYWVKIDGRILECRIKGRLRLKGIKSTNPVAVGDIVQIEPEGEKQGVIKEIEDRHNYIIRKSVNLSKQTQIIAANIDQAVLIVTLDFPKTFPRFIDRFLVTAEAYDIPAVLVFNKTDLYGEALAEELDYYKAAYREAGYGVLLTSAIKEEGITEFKALLKDKVTLVSGHSGVGKSTLINKVQPQLSLKTEEISEAHLQGQHTTTFAEMFELDFGGAIIDTPGIRGFGLVDMNAHELGDYFPEILKLKPFCKFNNCLHLDEPECAVKEAVDNHRLAPTRYESYVSFINDDENEDPYRQDIYAG